MRWITKNYTWLIVLLFILIGGILRFYNLSWGAPYYFHPDERNMATAITNLSFPDQLNPHFFAYGSLPLYTAYFMGLLQNIITSQTGEAFLRSVSFEQAIYILRIISAVISTALITLLFLIGKKLMSKQVGIFAAFFATTSIGLIQYAHFGTVEIILTFLCSMLFFIHLLIWETKKQKYRILLAIIFGLLVATKISSLILLPLLFLLPELFSQKSNRQLVFSLVKQGLLLSSISALLFIVINPYSIIDFPSFYSSITYESHVATLEHAVFYTGEFVKTTPILYHLTNIYPFLLNPLLFLFMLPSISFIIYLGIKKKKSIYLLLILYTFVLFFTQAFLFVKWTRYLIPTLPFIYLILSLFLSELSIFMKSKTRRGISTFAFSFFSGVCLVFAFAFTKTVYMETDTRIQAAKWAAVKLPSNATILSEVYDLGIIPFNERFPKITLYNFYDLDTSSTDYNNDTLQIALDTHSYLILPSQRLVKSRILHPDVFPKGEVFYSSLLQGTSSYKLLYTTPCDIWCRITYWNDPVFAFEGTANIFDRPTVFIFGKK